MTAVVDASVAIKWFLLEPETPRALQLAQDILSGRGVFLVPELFYFEVFAVLSRKHKRFHTWAESGMRWLTDLPLQRVGLTQRLAVEMARFSKFGLTGYDSAYAALATLHHATWLTFDDRARSLLNAPKWIAAP